MLFKKITIFALEKTMKFQMCMNKIDSNVKPITLRQRIAAMPEGCVLFRTDFPDYHSEFVGSTLAEMCKEGVLVKLAQGIYSKPRKSQFGNVLPSVEKIVQAIAKRDKSQVIPSGVTALNALGLSTQVPTIYTFLTTGSERSINLGHQVVKLKHGVPKNFCYSTQLIALLTQALKSLKKENVGQSELQTIRALIANEPDKESVTQDVKMMPAWMNKIIKPMLVA